MKSVLLFTFAGIVVFLIIASSCFYYNRLLQRTLQMDSDICWIEDNLYFYRVSQKKMPVNWNDLFDFANKIPYPPIEGIETRMEINFDYLIQLNLSKAMLELDTPYIWIYRFHDKKKLIQQERLLDRLLRLDNNSMHRECPCPRVLTRPEDD